MANIIALNDTYYCNFSKKNQFMGISLLLPYALVSLALDFIQMVLAVWKHL